MVRRGKNCFVFQTVIECSVEVNYIKTSTMCWLFPSTEDIVFMSGVIIDITVAIEEQSDVD